MGQIDICEDRDMTQIRGIELMDRTQLYRVSLNIFKQMLFSKIIKLFYKIIILIIYNFALYFYRIIVSVNKAIIN